MVALWLLSMVVLINVYIGAFTAIMPVNKLKSTVDTLEDLAFSQTLRMTVELNSNVRHRALVRNQSRFFIYAIMGNR